jgi:hypothetical protein
MDPAPLPLPARLWLAFVCWCKVLLDGVFAARVRALGEPSPALPALREAQAEAPPEARPRPRPGAPDAGAALQLLGLLQREGRLVDFVQQDITAFADADVGAAARVVHDGCSKALSAHVRIVAIRAEPEGSPATLEPGFDRSAVKLIGDIRGAGPWRGTLRHRGWRAESITLPELVGDQDARVLAPAEIEL